MAQQATSSHPSVTLSVSKGTIYESPSQAIATATNQFSIMNYQPSTPYTTSYVPPSAIGVPVFDLESYQNAPGYAAQTIDRMGAWRAGLFDCCKHSLFPNCCMATFCPYVSIAQILTRVGSEQSYGRRLCSFLFPIPFSAVMVLAAFLPMSSDKDPQPRQHLWIVAMAVASTWFWYTLVVLNARRKVTLTFKIPQGGYLQDPVLAMFCGPCVLAQPATPRTKLQTSFVLVWSTRHISTIPVDYSR